MKELLLKMEGMGRMLTKEQMKNIIGGQVVTSGCGVTSGGTLIGFIPCDSDVCSCQDAADEACEDFDWCDDVDCGCK